MKKISPQEKKAFSYKKDHISPSENANKYRKGWRKKKVIEQRSERRRIKQTISESIHEESLNTEEIDFPLVLRKKLEKWRSTNLLEWLRHKIESRKVFTARNYFKDKYNRERHESLFSNFLENVIAGNVDNPKEIAIFLKNSMIGDLKQKGKYSLELFSLKERHLWLSNYFEDNRAMKERIENWINTILKSD